MNRPEKFWDKMADRYDKNLEKYMLTKIKTIDKTKNYLKKSDTILDYGCGTGLFAYKLADNVKEIYAIDISSKMIEIAKNKEDRHRKQNINFLQASIFDEKLKEESFDVVVAIGILHLLKDEQKVVKRIYQLLKPGGFFISSTACMGQQKKAIPILINSIVSVLSIIGIFPGNLRFFSISKLEQLITNENFRILETESRNFERLTGENQKNHQAYVIAHFIAAKKI